MPQPGRRWRFVTIGTHNSWRPGDERGWRSRGHRIHSSGDYRNSPPLSEHRGLREWVNARSGRAVVVPRDLREVVGQALIRALADMGYRVAAASVSGQHAHVLVELPADLKEVRAIGGEAKRHSSRAIRSRLAGHVWAGGGDFKPIDSREAQTRAYRYVVFRQGAGACTWGVREREREP